MGYIYLIVNNANGKCYAGQTKDIKKRKHFRDAWIKSGSSYNTLIYRAIRKYGNESFTLYSFEVPEDFRDEGERLLIEMYNCMHPNGYNMESGGCLNKHHNKESIEKMRNARLAHLNPELYIVLCENGCKVIKEKKKLTQNDKYKIARAKKVQAAREEYQRQKKEDEEKLFRMWRPDIRYEGVWYFESKKKRNAPAREA